MVLLVFYKNKLIWAARNSGLIVKQVNYCQSAGYIASLELGCTRFYVLAVGLTSLSRLFLIGL
jgi:hypothetical protein